VTDRGRALYEVLDVEVADSHDIGHELRISEETVKTHVASILAKLNLADRRQAAIYALQQRMVPLDAALDADRG
jgi:ATP/maltotriose-dependent transcriptional regulator MalT